MSEGVGYFFPNKFLNLLDKVDHLIIGGGMAYTSASKGLEMVLILHSPTDKIIFFNFLSFFKTDNASSYMN